MRTFLSRPPLLITYLKISEATLQQELGARRASDWRISSVLQCVAQHVMELLIIDPT